MIATSAGLVTDPQAVHDAGMPMERSSPCRWTSSTDPTNTDVVIGPAKYDPFGGYDTATGADRIGYRGELTASNLIHLPARDYDPATGQFTSRDPLDGVNGTPVVANFYHYTDNDPLNGTDPLGLQTTDDDFPNGATASTMTFRFPVDNNHKWFGAIDIADYIPEKQTTMSPGHMPGPRLFLGDNRGPTPAGTSIDPNRNRFYAKIDFSTGTGFMQVNPTCRATSMISTPPPGHGWDVSWLPGGKCSSARDLVYGVFDGNNPHSAGYDRNYGVMQRSGSTYRFKWSVVHADQGFAQDAMRPRADGKLDFDFVKGGKFVETTWRGDCFPSLEVMRHSGGTTQVLGRVDDAGAEAMAGVVTNTYSSWLVGVC